MGEKKSVKTAKDGARKRRRRRASKAGSELTRLYATIGTDYAKGLIHPDKHSLDCLLSLRVRLQSFFRSERQQEAAQFLFLVWCESFGFDNDLGEGRKQFDQAIKPLTEKQRGRPPGERGQKARKIKEEDKDRTYRQILVQLLADEGKTLSDLEDPKHEIEKLKGQQRQHRRRTKGRIKGRGE
jgi:hypothetical protein